MRAILGAAAVLAFAGFCAGQDEKDKKAEPIDAKKLVGKWELADAKGGIVVEFTAKGKCVVSVDVGGSTEKIEGTYKLDGAKLEMVLTIEGKERRETVTVTRLTDDEFAGTDSAGKEDKFKRFKAKT